ncbi:uncharacterized protein I303_103044 [Kwoniella dejecticola CBS 10117]|uniref:Protein phosphatase 4 regulatory subunit 1 n=1 Tax=Kwoniella dejecticola CBS 10117 TaxID=1296121 RepID=A0A1A6AAF8_9TREE|nr:uncharacterized protein I303_03064 [Kwoniella dejecticola CBS 10117]OBR87041.1 hypothetical protein I303_03064 [Kwoniella dejecticola CBS 10117]
MGSASRSGSEGTPTASEKDGDGRTPTPKLNATVESDPPLAPYDQIVPSSPPLPPPDFNPPADFPVDSPVSSISTPSVSSATSPTGSNLFASPAEASPSIFPPGEYSHLQRPALQSIQRVSSDSINTPGSTGSGASSLSSDQSSGDHLVEMREDLKEKLLHSEVSTPSRTRSSSTSTTTAESFRFNLINPTPPSEAALFEDYEDDDYNAEAGPSVPRRLSSGAMAHLDDGYDMPVEHAWDSVWPAPGSAHRSAPPESGPSRFPIAPVSPFVTPAFSPAIIPTTSSSSSLSRKPPSPIVDPHDPVSPSRRSQSPVTNPFRFSPRSGGTSPNMESHNQAEMYYGGRRRSVTAEAPLLAHSPPSSAPISINLSRHNRSLSNSSQNSPSSRTFFHRRPKPTAPPLSTSANRLNNPGASPPISADSKGRPRGHSLSSTVRTQQFSIDQPNASSSGPRQVSPSVGPSRPDQKEERPVSPFKSSASLPPISLPPALAQPPNPFPEPAQISVASNPTRPPSPPLFAPLARPAVLRRALSDYDAKARNTPPSFHRTLSITAELDKSPKRSTASADIKSPSDIKESIDIDLARTKKSPRKSPNVLPVISPLSARSAGPLGNAEERVGDLAETSAVQSYFPDVDTPGWTGESAADHMGDVDIVDEGDVLPMGDVQMDVTFDDEGLNTLERIFLLSKSEYPFHRAYVARVLGDLLNEVDPCESVEYVLPLLSGFSMDDDESVKEAFASELHRILWYFFSTCKLLIDDGEGEMIEVSEPSGYIVPREGHPPEARKETVTITSEGMNAVPTPTVAEATENAIPMGRPRSNSSLLSTSSATDPSSSGSSLTRPPSTKFSPGILDGPDIDTPNSSISASSQDTAFSPGIYIKPYAESGDQDVDMSKADQGALVDRPVLSVSFFTPLVGSLLLNQNPVISESVRNGVVAILERLRGKGETTLEIWGHVAQQAEADERRGYATQNGPHQHDLRPFFHEARMVVERELIQGIVIGMGQLSTDMPDMMFEDPDQGSEDEIRDHEAFQAQLVQEATAGRATSMNLIGAVSEFYEQHEIVENGFIEEVLASSDGDVPVRAEAAVAMSCLAKIIPVEHIYSMLPLFEMFCEDENDHVKQSACLALPALCRRIESAEERRSFAVKAVQTLIAGDEDVRCAALEMLGEVIHIFHDNPNGPPDALIDVYTDDSEVRDGERDSDWDVVAIFNLPGVCLTLGSERWSDIRDLFQRLQDRAGEKVLRTTASCLHELTKILRPDQVVSDVLPVYTRLLGDSEEIRERVFEHVDVIIASVPKEVGWSLFRHLARGWKEGMLGGWRAREKLGLHIPSFLEIFAGWNGIEEILEMMRDALLDPFAAVRDAVTKGIPKAYEILGTRSPVAKKFRDILLGLGDSRVFKQRLTFIRCLREFVKPPPNRQAFEDFFLPVLPRLSKDVIDVRLGLAQIIADLFVVGAYYSNVGQNVPKTIWEIAHQLAQDESADVRDTVRKVNMDRARPTGKGKDVRVPYEVNVDGVKQDRSLKPGERDRNHSPKNSTTSRQTSGDSFASVSNTSIASEREDRKSSSKSSSSSSSSSTITSLDPTPHRQSPASAISSSMASNDQPPSDRPMTVPNRRPSGEVMTKLGLMDLSAPSESNPQAGQSSSPMASNPRILDVPIPAKEGAFVKSPISALPDRDHNDNKHNEELDTLEKATARVDPDPFASSFGEATSSTPESA